MGSGDTVVSNYKPQKQFFHCSGVTVKVQDQGGLVITKESMGRFGEEKFNLTAAAEEEAEAGAEHMNNKGTL